MSKTEKLRDQILSQDPTQEQEDAIFSEELEFLLRASPGSGKTWTSCRRFIWRGANWDYQVGGLALLSFTNTAIREFQEATVKVGRRELLSDPNYVGTFDSFVERFIITPFGHLISGSKKRPKLFIAPRPGDRKNMKLNAWMEGRGGRKMPVPAWEIEPFVENEEVAFRTSRSYGGKTLDFERNDPVNELFSLGYYTHAHRAYLACCILFDRPHIAKCLSRRFPEIVIDEAQDTNIWLLEVLNCLRENGTKVTLVGDPDQCIYEFSLADPSYIPDLREEWGIPEKPLNKSFRCNDIIAESVRNISGNALFTGCGGIRNENHRPFIVREPSPRFEKSIEEFKRLLNLAEISLSNSSILCRARKQLETIRGEVNYTNLKGNPQNMALAAFSRDIKKDFSKAYQIVEKVVREVTEDPEFWESYDENPNSDASERTRLILWKFTKSTNGLPLINENGNIWFENLKTNLTELFRGMGMVNIPKMGNKFKKTGLKSNQLNLPLFEAQTLFPAIRHTTIHQVKGESIDGVLVLGSVRFFNSVVNAVNSNENSEDRRLAYVAMTRARHTLLVALPATHYDNHLATWQDCGFKIL